MRVRTRVLGLLAAALTMVGVGAMTEASTASASALSSISGTAECGAGGNVEGIWIQVQSGGGSNWATMSVPGNTSTYVGWSFPISSSTVYQARVGCGGQPSSWTYTTYSDWISGSSDLICSPGYVSGKTNYCAQS